MNLEKKIALIVDTNILTYSKNKTQDLSNLPLEKYYKIIKTIELNNLNNEITILFPEIVLLELISHLKKKLNKNIDILKKIHTEMNKFNGITLDYKNFNIDELCEKLKNDYYNQLNIIDIPPDRNKLFNEILNMSLNKNPPFIEGKSDKGFKDSILFLSIEKFAEENLYDKYVLFSKDKAFVSNESDLKEHFKNHLKKYRKNNSFNLFQIHSTDINLYIEKEYELFQDLKEYIIEEFYKILNNNYTKFDYIKCSFEEYELYDFELIEEDTTIYQIEDSIFEVEFFLYLDYRYQKNDIIFDDFEYDYETKNVIQSEVYYFEKDDNEKWNYNLSFREYKLI